MGDYNPWRVLRRLSHLTLVWGSLPEDELGRTEFATGTIRMQQGLLQCERRSTLAHELVHVERGECPSWLQPREERIADQIASRRLIPWELLVEAAVWSGDEHEFADFCHVDLEMARARLAGLSAAEGRELVSILDQRELRNA